MEIMRRAPGEVASASVVGGGGGGRKDMAQAGGKDPSRLKDAVAEGVETLKGMIK